MQYEEIVKLAQSYGGNARRYDDHYIVVYGIPADKTARGLQLDLAHRGHDCLDNSRVQSADGTHFFVRETPLIPAPRKSRAEIFFSRLFLAAGGTFAVCMVAALVCFAVGFGAIAFHWMWLQLH